MSLCFLTSWYGSCSSGSRSWKMGKHSLNRGLPKRPPTSRPLCRQPFRTAISLSHVSPKFWRQRGRLAFAVWMTPGRSVAPCQPTLVDSHQISTSRKVESPTLQGFLEGMVVCIRNVQTGRKGFYDGFKIQPLALPLVGLDRIKQHLR